MICVSSAAEPPGSGWKCRSTRWNDSRCEPKRRMQRRKDCLFVPPALRGRSARGASASTPQLHRHFWWHPGHRCSCIFFRPIKQCRMAERKHIVVLGAGFGGLTFCQHFRAPAAQVTVVDRTNHYLFQPLLYQVATAGLSAPEIAQPIRSILSRRPNITVLLDQVADFDLAGNLVVLQQKRLHYDYLVLALGGCST